MDTRIAEAMKEIEQRLSEPLSVPELARAAGLSASRFAHLFRMHTGVSPIRYLRDRRMERAGALLEQSFLTVKEVMVLVGCTDPSHFARDFRRYHGLPPRQWRDEAEAKRDDPWRERGEQAAGCNPPSRVTPRG